VGARPVGGHPREGARWCKGEEGNILVLFALLLTTFLGCCAIAIDVGYWWVAGKRAQIAADACALAAAQELPHVYDDMGHCVVEAGQEDYVLTHLPDQSPPGADPKHLWTRVRSPYNGDASMVEATIQLRVGTFFGRIFGVEDVIVERRAVAERIEGDTKLAIFAGSTDCSGGKGLRIDGDNINVTGHAHSNGEFTVNGAAPPEQVEITSGTIAKENCVADTNPDGPPPSSAGAKFGSGDEWLPQDGPELQWPDWWYPADFGWYLPEGSGTGLCTYKGEHIQVTDTHLKITGRSDQPLAADPDKPGWTIVPTGTYCATASFTIGGNNHSGEITALSPLVVVNGNGQDYTPHVANMLFFTVPNSNTTLDDAPFTLGNFMPPNVPPYPPCSPSPAADTNLDGENYTWAGIIFNPCGKVKINNKTSSVGTPQLVGTIYGFMVEINGDDFNMVGTEDVNQNVSLALVE
jgi:Putative Flp pilus-assembly TadE/G-like